MSETQIVIGEKAKSSSNTLSLCTEELCVFLGSDSGSSHAEAENVETLNYSFVDMIKASVSFSLSKHSY